MIYFFIVLIMDILFWHFALLCRPLNAACSIVCLIHYYESLLHRWDQTGNSFLWDVIPHLLDFLAYLCRSCGSGLGDLMWWSMVSHKWSMGDRLLYWPGQCMECIYSHEVLCEVGGVWADIFLLKNQPMTLDTGMTLVWIASSMQH